MSKAKMNKALFEALDEILKADIENTKGKVIDFAMMVADDDFVGMGHEMDRLKENTKRLQHLRDVLIALHNEYEV